MISSPHNNSVGGEDEWWLMSGEDIFTNLTTWSLSSVRYYSLMLVVIYPHGGDSVWAQVKQIVRLYFYHKKPVGGWFFCKHIWGILRIT